MRNIILSVTLLLCIATTGCLNDSNTKIQTAQPPPQLAVPATGDANTNSTPATTPTTNVTTIPATTASTATAGLNPAHGQPGHRCDIEVGAPLNSKPAPATAQPQAAKPSPVVAQPVVVPQAATAAGLNPAHGQPGHRCDLAVGAPLNSKPAQ